MTKQQPHKDITAVLKPIGRNLGAVEDTATNHGGEVQRRLRHRGRQTDVRRKPLESDEEAIAREAVRIMQQ